MLVTRWCTDMLRSRPCCLHRKTRGHGYAVSAYVQHSDTTLTAFDVSVRTWRDVVWLYGRTGFLLTICRAFMTVAALLNHRSHVSLDHLGAGKAYWVVYPAEAFMPEAMA
jgi:hypothetical protein